MLIKVLKTINAAKNQSGIECQEYLANETYEIFNELAKVFIKENWGVEVIEKIAEQKAIEDYENKAIDNLKNKSVKTKKGKLNND